MPLPPKTAAAETATTDTAPLYRLSNRSFGTWLCPWRVDCLSEGCGAETATSKTAVAKAATPRAAITRPLPHGVLNSAYEPSPLITATTLSSFKRNSPGPHAATAATPSS